MKRLAPVSFSLQCLFVAIVLFTVAGPAFAEPPKTAVCAICGVTEGSGPEPVAASLEYRGKTYYFCKEEEKEIFLKDPERWAAANAGKAPPPPQESSAPS